MGGGGGKSSCSDGDNCNDTVERTTTWTGYIALPYITDYVYASNESICETNMLAQDSSNTYICRSNNWIYSKYNVWYLAFYAAFGFANYVQIVFPAIYLKSNVIIESGNGSESNPYMLKLNS